MIDMTTTETPVAEPIAPTSDVGTCVYEDLKVEGEDLVAKIRDLIHEGNVRRIIIKNSEGNVLAEVPVTLGVVGAVIAPSLAVVGAIAAVVSDCSITIERQVDPSSEAASSQAIDA
jgi:hypothetical protein